MSLITRLRSATYALRHPEVLEATANVDRRRTVGHRDQKAAPQMWANWREMQPSWVWDNTQAYINEGFGGNAILYAACIYKVRAMRLAPLRVYMGEPDNPTPAPAEHPLTRLVARPNPHQSRSEFNDLVGVYYNLLGSAFVLFDRTDPDTGKYVVGGAPSAMYVLRPDRVAVIPSRDKRQTILGYVYVPPGVSVADGLPVVAQDMMHIKMPNPADPLGGFGHGMSPVRPMASSGDVDNEVTAFLKKFFEYGAMFQILLSFDYEMDEEEMARVRTRFVETYGGYENWGEPGILDAHGKIERMTPTFEEMGFEVIDERNETRMLGPLGVPPILVGSRVGLKHATYENFEHARLLCWEDTLIPDMRAIEDEYQHYLKTEDGAFVQYDISQVPALRTRVEVQTASVLNLVQAGVPVKVACRAVGLKVEDFEESAPISVEAGDSERSKPAQIERKAASSDSAGYAVLYLEKAEGLLGLQEAAVQAAKDADVEFEPTARDELHITLVYAGTVSDEALRSIGEQVRDGELFTGFSLAGTELDWFGDEQDRQALVLRVADAGDYDDLRQFQAQVFALFEARDGDLNLSAYSTPDQWQAHVTLGYGKQFEHAGGVDVEFDAKRFAVAREEYNDVVEVEAQPKAKTPRRFKSYDPADMQVKMDGLATDWEGRFGDVAKAQFDEDLREIRALITENKQAARAQKASIDWKKITGEILDYLNHEADDKWREKFVPLVEGLMLEAGEEWALALGVQFNLRNLEGEAWFADYMLKFAKPINETTIESIQAVLAQGQAEGWSISKLEDNLGTLFQQWMDGDLTADDFAWFEERMPPHRRDLIARTETMRASNAGALNLGTEWGVTAKGWAATYDGRARPSHETAGRDYAEGKFIKINELFVVGGHKMAHPLDMTNGAPLKEVANCRCALLLGELADE